MSENRFPSSEKARAFATYGANIGGKTDDSHLLNKENSVYGLLLKVFKAIEKCENAINDFGTEIRKVADLTNRAAVADLANRAAVVDHTNRAAGIKMFSGVCSYEDMPALAEMIRLETIRRHQHFTAHNFKAFHNHLTTFDLVNALTKAPALVSAMTMINDSVMSENIKVDFEFNRLAYVKPFDSEIEELKACVNSLTAAVVPNVLSYANYEVKTVSGTITLADTLKSLQLRQL